MAHVCGGDTRVCRKARRCSQDGSLRVDAIVPPLKGKEVQLRELAQQSFLPLDVDGDRQYLISMRHGALLDRPRLVQLLKGESMSLERTAPD